MDVWTLSINGMLQMLLDIDACCNIVRHSSTRWELVEIYREFCASKEAHDTQHALLIQYASKFMHLPMLPLPVDGACFWDALAANPVDKTRIADAFATVRDEQVRRLVAQRAQRDHIVAVMGVEALSRACLAKALHKPNRIGILLRTLQNATQHAWMASHGCDGVVAKTIGLAAAHTFQTRVTAVLHRQAPDTVRLTDHRAACSTRKISAKRADSRC